MQQGFTIHVPKPCSQPWEDMTPQEQDRFCGSCQRTVVDFTRMSDQEIAAYLKASTGKVCGKVTVFKSDF